MKKIQLFSDTKLKKSEVLNFSGNYEYSLILRPNLTISSFLKELDISCNT